jgi:beta-mannosidase
LRNGTNLLKIIFKSAVSIGRRNALEQPLVYPADNEEGEIKISPFVRKAAFQFGWDINPRFISCGIWRPIKIIAKSKNIALVEEKKLSSTEVKPFYLLHKTKDNEGESFVFKSNDKKLEQTFMYGANYVPYNMYPLPLKNYKRVAHIQKNQGLLNRNDYYRNLFAELKNYGCNMLRVWGGGWYEDDYFYELADSMHIAIWQDFMFANTMYPGNDDWLNSVKQEIEYNVIRLSKHPSVVLWCGNNEIEVAWKNWGWQKKYHYNKSDSLKLMYDYKLLFDSLIPAEIKKQKSKVFYLPSSPISNWGRSEDFKTGDNHYWGIWHGEAPLDDFNKHVPRFASEYGMPSLGTKANVNLYTPTIAGLYYQNPILWNRMKSYKGMKLLNRYIKDDLPAPISDSSLSYASRYIQLKALKLAINAHLYNFPYCAGSLFWQFNESWPGITWAAIDFSGQRKIPPYLSAISLMLDQNKKLNLKANTTFNDEISSIEFYLKDAAGSLIKSHVLKANNKALKSGIVFDIEKQFDSLDFKNKYLKIEIKNTEIKNNNAVWDTIILLVKEKDYNLYKPTFTISKLDDNHIKILANTLVLGLFVESNLNSKIVFNHNFFHLEKGIEKIITIGGDYQTFDENKLRFFSVYDLQDHRKE